MGQKITPRQTQWWRHQAATTKRKCPEGAGREVAVPQEPGVTVLGVFALALQC